MNEAAENLASLTACAAGGRAKQRPPADRKTKYRGVGFLPCVTPVTGKSMEALRDEIDLPTVKGKFGRQRLPRRSGPVPAGLD